MTDASGNIAATWNYDSFGNVTSTTGGVNGIPASSLTRYTYTGREADPDTGLMYYRARWYDPQQGRFISEDPIGFEGGVNFYRYVSNNPLNFTDPLGLQDGPVNYLRDPFSTDHWIANGLSNSLSDLLFLDHFAEWAWIVGDHCRPMRERVTAAAKGVATAAFLTVGGQLIGRVVGKIAGRISARLGKGAAGDWAKLAGMLGDASKGKGNFGIGSASREQADALGRAWVGDASRIASDGRTLLSADGLRQYRPPSFKPNLGRIQANLEWRVEGLRQWQGNAHIDIVP